MLSLRALAIVITGAGVFAGLPLPDAKACDDDRYPCPVRAEVLTQETAEMPIESAPSAQPQKKSAPQQKKAKQPAGPNEKAHAKRDAKASKPAVQEKTTDSVSQKAPEANPEVVPSPRAEEPPNDERPVTTAGTAWPVLPSTEGVGVTVATGGEPTEAANPNAVQLVDPNEINELDRGAAATVSTESSWSIYLLLILGAALAAAATVWLFTKLTAVYARRAAGLRMHMRSDW
jgi:outer membrane biosynthesis protein TonB